MCYGAPMNNYVQLWIVAVIDPTIPAIITFAPLESAQEAQDWAAGFTSPNETHVTMYYFKLNKHLICNPLVQGWMNSTFPIDISTGQLFPSPDFYTQSAKDAQAWSIKAQYWVTDPADKASVKAAAIAKQNAFSKVMKPAIVNMTVAQMIASSLIAVSQIKRADYFACATDLKNLQRRYNSGELTASDALLAYEKIVDKYPEIFVI